MEVDATDAAAGAARRCADASGDQVAVAPLLQKQRTQGRFASRTLVVGNRDDVEYVVRTLQPDRRIRVQVVGATLLDGNARDIVIDDTRFPVLGNVNSVSSVAAEVGADTINVASRPEGEPEFVKQLSWQLEGTAAELVLSSRLTDRRGSAHLLRTRRGPAADPGADPDLRRRTAPAEAGTGRRRRHARADPDRPAGACPRAAHQDGLARSRLLLQERVGRDGRRFKMVKFRSMKTDARSSSPCSRSRTRAQVSSSR